VRELDDVPVERPSGQVMVVELGDDGDELGAGEGALHQVEHEAGEDYILLSGDVVVGRTVIRAVSVDLFEADAAVFAPETSGELVKGGPKVVRLKGAVLAAVAYQPAAGAQPRVADKCLFADIAGFHGEDLDRDLYGDWRF
jgi:hypothetical protein